MNINEMMQEDMKIATNPIEEKVTSIKENIEVIEEEIITFNPNLLPQNIAPFIKDVANRMNNAPLSFAGTSALCVLSSAIGRRVGVRTKLNDDWTNSHNISS